MKAEIHPEYQEAKVKCVCGNTWTTRSTVAEIQVDICSACHPFFTGKQKLVDTAGRVERFRRRYAKTEARKQAEAEAAAKKAAEEAGTTAATAADKPAPKAEKPKAKAEKPEAKTEAAPKVERAAKAESAPKDESEAASADDVDTVEMEAPAVDESKES